VKKRGKTRSQGYSVTLPDPLTISAGTPAHEQIALIHVALASGNVHRLIEYIRRGPQLTGPLQDLFIALLLRKVKFPKKRPTDTDTGQRHFDMAWFVAMRERDNVRREEATGEAEDKFGVDRRTVQRAIKEWRPLLSDPKNIGNFLTLFAMSADNLRRTRVTLKVIPTASKPAPAA
jgi:hypothetical protein